MVITDLRLGNKNVRNGNVCFDEVNLKELKLYKRPTRRAHKMFVETEEILFYSPLIMFLDLCGDFYC